MFARFLLAFLLVSSASAVKFSLTATRYPPPKCIWNPAHKNSLVIVTANVAVVNGDRQQVDIEIVANSRGDESGEDEGSGSDGAIGYGTDSRNVYLNKRDIRGETRLAITTHSDGEVGVCFRNYLNKDIKSDTGKHSRIIDLDVDIGADAVDYNAIANQESLSGLETEMRKLEGLTKEIVEQMGYLKKREERFTDTNTSTNSRVTNFAWFTIFSLAGLGTWQILHLRAFFKRKYLID
ncbi:hypothetical protein CYLTODRAFT_374032 [Cylindrobasidium torrendii FP15055 ss-10]|uniref:GOLD domain-containing protein n=1 Tax=Cylindrobasidium torrendii FP15055 ss-10 TaxID=1314674 RepID=A0A0D7BET0_9AGAR|nr:hypothetical protein CYLTODRAFT_374032 [Cylindrobasidium torrendii FP15055 ss-10]